MSDAGDASRAALRALQALGALWTLPNTLAGLLLGVAGMPFGAHAHLRGRECAMVFHRWPWGPGGAITLGNVILHTGDTLDSPCVTYAHRAGHAEEAPIVLADHERAYIDGERRDPSAVRRAGCLGGCRAHATLVRFARAAVRARS